MENKTKAQKIRDYMKANPNASSGEIAVACSVKPQHVHQVNYNLKRTNGKQPRAYRKTTIDKKVEPQVIKVKRKNIVVLKQGSKSEIEILRMDIAIKENKIKALEQSIIGYRAVIDFLEYQLGLNRNNHGATV